MDLAEIERLLGAGARSLLQGIAQAGSRLVAVGQCGHVLVSRDNGESWTQSYVPVSSDLTAVYFVDAREGWAVGHDGVILHSGDGGEHWTVQLTGRKANDLLLQAMEERAAAQAVGRDPAGLHVVCRGSFRIHDTPQGPNRRALWGTLDEIREDIQRYAEAGLTELFLEGNFTLADAPIERALEVMTQLAPR